MTHDEAKQEAARLGREHPGRTWLAREDEAGEWDVAEVRLPEGMKPNGPLTNAVEQRPKPPQPDDPRPLHDRNVGGPYGA